MSAISKSQLVRLQVLYAQYARHEIGVGTSREDRLAWATKELGYPVLSFSRLSLDEARRLIDRLQRVLGVRVPPRRRTSRAAARSAGTEGRHDGNSKMRTFATQQDIDRIQDALTRLGWSQEQFKAWLRSPRSPLAKRINGVRIAPVDPKLRTLYETNRVWWALKGMLQARELWRQNAPAK